MAGMQKRAAWLCLLLALFSLYAATFHHHSSSIEAAKCTVCAASRSASPVVASKATHARFVPVSMLVLEPLSIIHQRISVFALTVRPPPQS